MAGYRLRFAAIKKKMQASISRNPGPEWRGHEFPTISYQRPSIKRLISLCFFNFVSRDSFYSRFPRERAPQLATANYQAINNNTNTSASRSIRIRSIPRIRRRATLDPIYISLSIISLSSLSLPLFFHRTFVGRSLSRTGGKKWKIKIQRRTKTTGW